MAQLVIGAKDVDIFLDFKAIGVAFKLETGSNFSASITGTTEDIGAISTDEPIAVVNGGSTYDITFSLQVAEANFIKDALAAKTASDAAGSIAHMRQIEGTLEISVVWHKLGDVPATSSKVTFTKCTGVEESNTVDRRATETLETWHFRARGIIRNTYPI